MIVRFFHIPFSGSIMGMILLLVALGTGLVKINWVSAAADLHFKHMILLFIPPITGIFFKLNILQGQIWKLIVVLIISSLLGLLGTGYAAELYEKFKKGEDEC
ncbi:CidA/LrgA family protein [Saccharococcus caldoxylosilyticus]|nr:CidA/LrgA family protein [Parageobacillus caldoxylosilyticus]